MRILFLSRWYPFPATNGSKIRVYNLLAHLGRTHHVDLVSFHAPEEPVGEADLEAMRAHCRDVRTVPYRPFQPGSLRALAGLFGAMPRSLADSYSHAFAGEVAAMAAATPYDVVIASQIDMPIYARDLEGPAKVLEEVEISIFREQLHRAEGLAARARKGLMWSKWRRFLGQVMDDVDLVTVVSQREAEPLFEISPGYARLAVVPNGADLTRLTGHFAVPAADTLVYTGALTYYVNFDAMAFWLRDVWPRVLAHRPSARLQMAGRTEGTRVAELPVYDSATHVGHKTDVRPLVQGAWASIIPERVGGGTRIKLFESLALGTPVIATRWAANGVEARDGEEILVADSAQELADAAGRLLGDTGLRQRLSRHGRTLIESKYDWRVIGAAFETRLEEAVRHRRDRR